MDEFAKLTELTTDPLAELLKEAVELARRAGEAHARLLQIERAHH